MSSSRIPSRPLAAAILSLVAVAACSTSTPSPSSATPPPTAATSPGTPSPTGMPSAAPSDVPSPADAALLLEVTTEGGFINPVATLSSVPLVVVDADGSIYSPGAATGDGTLVAPVEVRDVGAAGAAQILSALRAAGLDHQGEGSGVAADTGTTVFTAVVDGEQVVNRFVRSGPGRPGQPGGASGGPSGGSSDPGAAAFDLLTRLTDPTVAWGGSSPTPMAYVPVGYRVYVAPAAAAAAGTRVAWPLPTPLATFGRAASPDFGVSGLRTGVVLGADAMVLGAALGSAAPDSVLTSDGAWSVWIRPLFPDELGG